MKYYVYTLAYPDGAVFYVGKGQKNRIHEHEYEARTGKTANPHKVNVIRKIWAGGGEVVKEKIYHTDDEDAAYEVEEDTIAFYGISNLTNILEGGRGRSENDAAAHSIFMREHNYNAKTYPGLIDPFGAEYHNIKNLKRFCEEMGIDYRNIYALFSGKVDNYRGWRVIGRLSYCEDGRVMYEYPYLYEDIQENPTIYDNNQRLHYTYFL